MCDHESTEAEPAVWQLADDLKNIETVMVAILSPEKHRCVSEGVCMERGRSERGGVRGEE